jgi:hypothetical protein
MEFMEKGKAFMFLLVLLDARQVRSHFKSRFPKRLEGRALAGARAAQRGQSPAVIQMNSEFSHTAPFTDRETAAGFSHDKRKCFFFFYWFNPKSFSHHYNRADTLQKFRHIKIRCTNVKNKNTCK